MDRDIPPVVDASFSREFVKCISFQMTKSETASFSWEIVNWISFQMIKQYRICHFKCHEFDIENSMSFCCHLKWQKLKEMQMTSMFCGWKMRHICPSTSLLRLRYRRGTVVVWRQEWRTRREAATCAPERRTRTDGRGTTRRAIPRHELWGWLSTLKGNYCQINGAATKVRAESDDESIWEEKKSILIVFFRPKLRTWSNICTSVVKPWKNRKNKFR